ncbi:MAG TPA: nucleotidyl transferase AbiEii/AbiGii toxin family protein [Nitrososphaera sp.]|nr:nucleotidyl transferase AbiEii/AbiGii toxin family protein [Nitrososphaera sp.]
MIDAERIRAKAREERLGAAVVEKDYALTWLLRGFYLDGSQLKDSFVLKGGTAIRKAFFPGSWRFSEDLDFTVIPLRKKEEDDDNAYAIKDAVDKMLRMLQTESGIEFTVDSFHPNPGAIIASVQFRGPLNYRNRIKLDISLLEKMALPAEKRVVKSDFADLEDYEILAYSLKEITAEKIRSIMQRGYSRDYYDVWRLMKENRLVVDKKEIRDLLKRKCEMKGIAYEPDLLFDKERVEEARAHWSKSLSYLVKADLPNFESVLSELRQTLDFLK